MYAVDTFTAVNILVFDRFFPTFDDEIPLISRTVAKWIVTICIILTLVNLVYEYIRAWRIMKRGSVAECFLDNLAVRAESTRMGSGQGWRRFLVFAELTKSKKGAEYVALFTFFSFQSWIRVLLCNGPRQFVNAIFLYTYATSEFTIGSNDDFQTGLLSIFDKIKAIATEDPRQALILSGMLFTLVIWVFTFLSLLLSFFFYIFFLWHWIPRSDGGLSGYCERKINKRLMGIVAAKVNKAIAKEEQARLKAEKKAAKKNGEKGPEERQATLPSLMSDADSLPAMPTMQRAETFQTLPPYTSRPGSAGSAFEMGKMDQKRSYPNRSDTMASSAVSFSSKTPLVPGAAEMGYRPESPAPSLPALDLGSHHSTPHPTNFNRNFTTQTSSPLSRGTSIPAPYGAAYTSSPQMYTSEDASRMPPPPVRSMTGASSNSSFSRPSATPGPNEHQTTGSSTIGFSRPSVTPGPNGRQTPGASNPVFSRPSATGPNGHQAPSARLPYLGGQSTYSNGRPSPGISNYSQANTFSNSREPIRSATGPLPPRGPQLQYTPSRNMTAPMPAHQQLERDYFDTESNYNYDVESQRGPR